MAGGTVHQRTPEAGGGVQVSVRPAIGLRLPRRGYDARWRDAPIVSCQLSTISGKPGGWQE
jgi:hypothetical protein